MYILGTFFVIKGRLTVGTLLMFAEYFALLFTGLDAVNSKNAALRSNAPLLPAGLRDSGTAGADPRDCPAPSSAEEWRRTACCSAMLRTSLCFVR